MYEEKSFPLQEKKKKCLGKEFLLAQIHFSRLYFIHKRVHTNSEAMYIVLPLYFLFLADHLHVGVHISIFTVARFYNMKFDDHCMAFLSSL
jgi:hypothetical protein